MKKKEFTYDLYNILRDATLSHAELMRDYQDANNKYLAETTAEADRLFKGKAGKTRTKGDILETCIAGKLGEIYVTRTLAAAGIRVERATENNMINAFSNHELSKKLVETAMYHDLIVWNKDHPYILEIKNWKTGLSKGIKNFLDRHGDSNFSDFMVIASPKNLAINFNRIICIDGENTFQLIRSKEPEKVIYKVVSHNLNSVTFTEAEMIRCSQPEIMVRFQDESGNFNILPGWKIIPLLEQSMYQNGGFFIRKKNLPMKKHSA